MVRVRGADGFELFLRDNYEPVRRALALAIGDADRAEDLAQEAFVRALARWAAVSTMAWVYVVAMKKGRRALRRQGRPFNGAPLRAPEDVAGSVATSVALTAALATLATRQRAVVVLRYLAGLSTVEVAEALRGAEGTIKSTLHTALAKN